MAGTATAADPEAGTAGNGPWLPAVRAHLTPALAGERVWARVETLIGGLPVGGLMALEAHVRPEGPTERVDVSLRLEDAPRARRLARALASVPALADTATAVDAWSRADWFPDRVPALWLEFDLDERLQGPVPPPSLCARLTPTADADLVVGRLLPAIHPRSLSPAQRRTIHEMWPASRGADGDAFPLYAFSLRGRRADTIRLELYGERRAAFEPLRRRLPASATAGWDDAFSLLRGADRFHVSFDVGPNGPGDRLGFEAGFRRQPHREPGWRRLFDSLIAAGLVAEPVCAAALAWSGWEGPRSLSARGIDGGRIGSRSLARGLSHVKIVTRPGRPAQAKLYLVFEARGRRAG